MTAALSAYATTVPCGCAACVSRIMRNRLLSCAAPSITQLGVEDLVAAVLGVGLREHHQLDVGRIAAERAERRLEVVDLVLGEREAERDVGAPRARRGRAQATARSSSGRARGGRTARVASARSSNSDLDHAVVDLRQQRRAIARRTACAVRGGDMPERRRARCGSPRRVRSCARCRSPSTTRARSCRDAARPAARCPAPSSGASPWPVGQEALERRTLRRRKRTRRLDEVPVSRRQRGDAVRWPGAGTGLRAAWRSGTATAPAGRARRGFPSRAPRM